MRPPVRLLPIIVLLALTVPLAACQPHDEDRSTRTRPVAGAHEVTARDLQFEPPAIEVKPGTTVTWHFQDGAVPHDVKAGGFASGIRKNGTFSHRFDRQGTYSYRCTLHNGMTGLVIVTG